MKPPKILKALFNFCYVFMFLIVLITPLELLMYKIIDRPITFEINNRVIKDFSTPVIFLCIFKYSLIILDVYIVYLLKKLVESFFENKIYAAKQIYLFKKAGFLIIYTSIFKIISNFTAMILIEDTSRFRISFDIGFNNLLFIIALGLLFVFLGRVFQNAKNIKQENELTI